MEQRNITLSFDKAKEFYNSGNIALKEIALQAFTEEELTTLNFTEIKTFEDACKVLNLDVSSVMVDILNIKRLRLEADTSDHLIAIYKLDIIRKALNKNWKPKLTQGSVYYPYIHFFPAGQKAREAASNSNWTLNKSFTANGLEYTLVGGAYNSCSNMGLGYFGCGCGDVKPHLSLLGCQSKEIAKHMSRYFSKEIFEACYAQHIGTYEWV